MTASSLRPYPHPSSVSPNGSGTLRSLFSSRVLLILPKDVRDEGRERRDRSGQWRGRGEGAGPEEARGRASLVLLALWLVLPVVEAVDVAVAVQEAAVLLPAVGGRVLDVAVGAVLGRLAVELAVGLVASAVGAAVGTAIGEAPHGGTLEPLGEVGVLVEVPEEEPEHDGVEADPPHEAARVVAVGPEQELERVHEDGDELHHLDCGHVLLPPKVLGHVGPDGCQSVVEVHQDVHKAVYKSKERAVATWREFDTPPDTHWHHSMVDDVQRRDVSEFLS